MKPNNSHPTMDEKHFYTVSELTKTLLVHTPQFRLYLWRCPYGKDEVVFEGYTQCPGGIKCLVWRYEQGVSLATAKADLLEHGCFSPRPYQLAHARDGSITSCALALFARFCRDCGHDAEALMRAAYPNEKRHDLNDTVAYADWQGVAYGRNARKLVVAFERGDLITIREQGRRTTDTARLIDVWWWMKRSKAAKIQMEKLRARKAAKAARLAARQQRAATRALFRE